MATSSALFTLLSGTYSESLKEREAVDIDSKLFDTSTVIPSYTINQWTNSNGASPAHILFRYRTQSRDRQIEQQQPKKKDFIQLTPPLVDEHLNYMSNDPTQIK